MEAVEFLPESCEEAKRDPTDNSTGRINYLYIDCMISPWGLTPLGCIGVVFNLIALWAWTAERAFKPLTFFIKCLTVFDVFFMIFYTVHSFINAGRKNINSFMFLLFIPFRWIIVFCTTCIAVYQYMKVFHPDSAKKWFTFKFSIIATAICYLLGIIFVICRHFLSSIPKSHIFYTLGNIPFGVVPTFLQVVLIGRVMYELSRINRQIQSEPRQQSQPDASQISGMYKITSKEDRKKQRQLTYALCHIIFWSFLAFGVMTLMSVIMIVAYPEEYRRGYGECSKLSRIWYCTLTLPSTSFFTSW
jgi:hypothetical protein